MKFTLKSMAVSALSVAALGSLQVAHAQVDSTAISALRGTPRLEAAVPVQNQAGQICGLEKFVFQGSPTPAPPIAATFYCDGQRVEYVYDAWRAACPVGWTGKTIITDFNEDVSEWGWSNGVTYARGYAFCMKN